MSLAPRPSAGSVFWQRSAERFLALREQAIREKKIALSAAYHPEGWGLDDEPAFVDTTRGSWMLRHGTPETADEFKNVAAVCAVAFGAPNSDRAWVVWLDCLRRGSSGFEATEVQMSSLRREWRPEPDFDVEAGGLLMQPLPVIPDPDPQIVRSDIREFDDVCAVSERVCRNLADEATRVELAAATISPNGVHPSAARGAPESAPTEPVDKSATLTAQEAADALKISEDTLHRMRKRGEISMVKVGVQWRTTSSEVLRVRQRPKFPSR